MIFQAYPDRDALMRGLAAEIAGELAEGHASLSVPGGTTPGPVFDILAETELPWDRIAVFLNDERWVGEDNPRSNTRLLRERLLRGRAAAAKLVPLHADSATPETVLASLIDGLRPHMPISVLLVGMGADMHTASLFPGADLLVRAMANDAPLLLPMRADAAGEPRITLTAPALRSAENIHILITGNEKRAALDRATTLSPLEAPVGILLDRARVHWAE
jgi:6-phosphogluconolactonase